MGNALDWDDLRYFRCAAETLSLAGAARKLGVEHTTIGRRLDALEQALGAPLVLRGPSGLQLTRLGEEVVPLVDAVERAVQAVRDAVRTDRARVRLAMPSGFASMFAPGIARLTSEHPDLVLEIVSGSRPVDLARGEADVAIRSGPIESGELVVRKLCEAGFSLYASTIYLARRRTPIDPDDLRGHDVIGFDPGHAALPHAQWLAERTEGASIVLRSREMTDMLAAALSGAGLALLPCLLGDAEPTLRRVTPGVVASRRLSLVYRRESRLSGNVRAVVRFVCEVVAEHADRLAGVT